MNFWLLTIFLMEIDGDGLVGNPQLDDDGGGGTPPYQRFLLEDPDPLATEEHSDVDEWINERFGEELQGAAERPVPEMPVPELNIREQIDRMRSYNQEFPIVFTNEPVLEQVAVVRPNSNSPMEDPEELPDFENDAVDLTEAMDDDDTIAHD